MGTSVKIWKSQSVMVTCLLLSLLCANINRVCCFNGIQTGDWGGNNSNYTTIMATTRRAAAGVEFISDADDNEEFLMDSEVNRRILAERDGIGYRGLQGGQVICDSSGRYGNCIPTYNTPTRPCGFENRCSRND